MNYHLNLIFLADMNKSCKIGYIAFGIGKLIYLLFREHFAHGICTRSAAAHNDNFITLLEQLLCNISA